MTEQMIPQPKPPQELEGAELDGAVGMRVSIPMPWELHVNLRPENPPADWSPLLLVDHVTGERRPWSPSTDWSQGGPIIEREGIALFFGGIYEHNRWTAYRDGGRPHGEGDGPECDGPTPLIAAMRAFVASKS